MKSKVNLLQLLVVAFAAFLLPAWGQAQRSDESTRVKVKNPQDSQYLQAQEGIPSSDGHDPSQLTNKTGDGATQVNPSNEVEAVVHRKQTGEDTNATITQVTRKPESTPAPVEKKPAFLGVHYEMEFGAASGSHITKVEPGTPAFKAGLKMGDIITQADGIDLYQLEDLADIIGKKKAGEKVKITYVREGKSNSTWVILAIRDEDFFKNNQGPTYRIEKLPELKPGS